MALSRRDFLTAGGLATLALSASSCSVASRGMAQLELPESLEFPETLPPGNLTSADSAEDRLEYYVNPIKRLLDRAGYGPRPGDLARASDLGFKAFLEEQLHPERIDDPAAELLVRNLHTYHMDASQILGQDLRDSALDMAVATIGRAVYSRRQLYEAMVEFWSDHFNIYIRKNRMMLPLKVVDDREVIRPHAMGKFPDLLAASVQSPAMLVYLDNVRNVKGSPNENYARELLELHTMGIDSGYNQDDVQELARALTGWGVQRRGPRQGQFRYHPERHDQGSKNILDTILPAGQGDGDVYQILDILAGHPATATFISNKLVRRFVSDEPPAALVDQVAQVYEDTGGDIRQMLRVIFLSEEFSTAPPKLKRPYSFLVSALRSLNCDVGNYRSLLGWLELLGQPPFQWPAPDGYPDESLSWSNNLLPRWNFSLALLGGDVRGVRVPFGRLLDLAGKKRILDAMSGLILGRDLNPEERDHFDRYIGQQVADRQQAERLKETMALMLASPAFQWT